ncbi:GNAT family N-acetyltransferase [Kocuria turfanensis]|uniref:GNAT family N-acetyltransferase n=1 Tax=Kocuria turfanensis TaxID=388357 RepID=UPI00403713C2
MPWPIAWPIPGQPPCPGDRVPGPRPCAGRRRPSCPPPSCTASCDCGPTCSSWSRPAPTPSSTAGTSSPAAGTAGSSGTGGCSRRCGCSWRTPRTGPRCSGSAAWSPPRTRAGGAFSAALLRSALARCGPAPVVLDAQAHLEGWYGRFGFARIGETFLEDGIPHVPMRR